MALEIRPYREEDLAGMIKVWNEVVEAGEAFPQVEPLTMETARAFFAEQTLTTVAAIDDKLFGLYILHPTTWGAACTWPTPATPWRPARAAWGWAASS